MAKQLGWEGSMRAASMGACSAAAGAINAAMVPAAPILLAATPLLSFVTGVVGGVLVYRKGGF
jgi:hypothetical protein